MLMLLLALLAGQDVAGRVTVPAATDRRAPPTQPAATMVVEPVGMAIAAFDADGDGRTTRAELTAGVARSFAAIDTGHTGKLRYLDYADWALRWLGDRNALPSPFEVDTDGDDAISLAELQVAFAAAFDRFDKDHDGVVTRAELLVFGDRRGDGPPGGKRGRKPPR